MHDYFAVAIGGSIGAMLRFLVTDLLGYRLGRDFPYGTLAVNVAGSFLIGLLFVLLREKFPVTEPLRVGIIVGFLGALTTFSSFSLDTLALLEEGLLLRAGTNIVLNLVFCLFAVWAGTLLAGRWTA